MFCYTNMENKKMIMMLELMLMMLLLVMMMSLLVLLFTLPPHLSSTGPNHSLLVLEEIKKKVALKL